MLPLGDDNSARRITPFVTYALIAINVLVFVLVELPQGDIEAFFRQWGAVPAEILAGRSYITLLTSMFLHGGWMHLIGNMVFLWIFGDNVEDAFGHVLYLIFYLVCGLGASLAHILVSGSGPAGQVPGVGASGAIAGVLGSYIVMFGANRVRVLVGRAVTSLPAYAMIGLWIVTQLLSGFGGLNGGTGDNVAYWAHIGGFVVGLVLTFVLRGVVKPTLTTGGQRLQRR
ncbi:MAG TPA: rhomboid family intramembrane serine protease [Roseiflexaceae bacterium]|nr:rhomboid family intramembrane serine protease [Roseiflexaceae bacterium]